MGFPQNLGELDPDFEQTLEDTFEQMVDEEGLPEPDAPDANETEQQPEQPEQPEQEADDEQPE